MTLPHQEFNDDNIPLGYLITFRSYGTWQHGDSPYVLYEQGEPPP